MSTIKDFIKGVDQGLSQTQTISNPLSNVGGLPSASVVNERPIEFSARKAVHIFLPQIGVVKLFLNPSNIVYNFQKIINESQTKGGFSTSYWGEKLPTLDISGTTGSSGVEGINVLYEAYRSEQYAFDPSGLLISEQAYRSPVEMSAKNIIDSSMDVTNSILGGGSIGQAVGSLISNTLLVNNSSPYPDPPTLADLAFAVEIYYSGWVFRGFFESFTFTESADNFLYNYTMKFKVTQRRGYRLNYLPWHRSPNGLPHESPYSFEDDGHYTTTQPVRKNPVNFSQKNIKQVTQLQKNVTGR